MDELSGPPSANPWYRRLAIGFLFLFALLWSINGFFFITLLGLCIIFSVLAWDASGISMPDFGRTTRTGTGPVTGSSKPQVSRMVRIFIFVLGASFFFFIMVGIIAGNEGDGEASSETTSSDQTGISNSDRGTNFYNEGSYDSAMVYYDKALAQNSGDLDAQYGKALTYFSTGDLDAAQKWTNKSIRTKSDYNLSWWLLGDIYYTKQQYDSAAICLEKAYSYKTEGPDFFQLMALNYEGLGQKAKAIEFYRKVIEQDGARTEAYEHLITLDPDNASSYKTMLEKLK